MGYAPATSLLIAGRHSADDWRDLKARLHAGAEAWDEAYDRFFMTRITTRYFAPIDAIEKDAATRGEGFSIVALLCSLVEFVEGCESGLNYKYEEPRMKHEYGDTRKMFQDFLRRRVPLKNWLPDDLVEGFYTHVRCPLLHEARTTGGWRILIAADERNGQIAERISADTVALYRNTLRFAFTCYFDDYRERLLRKKSKQDAFIRKFDSLAMP